MTPPSKGGQYRDGIVEEGLGEIAVSFDMRVNARGHDYP
jgi:hypothetical protein